MALRDYILDNFWWKLLSFLLATLTWFTITAAFNRDQSLRESPVLTENRRTFPTVPIAMLAASSNSNLYRIQPTTVSVELGGPLAALSTLQERDVHAYVDITEASDEKRFRRNIQIRAPETVTVIHQGNVVATIERMPGSK